MVKKMKLYNVTFLYEPSGRILRHYVLAKYIDDIKTVIRRKLIMLFSPPVVSGITYETGDPGDLIPNITVHDIMEISTEVTTDNLH